MYIVHCIYTSALCIFSTFAKILFASVLVSYNYPLGPKMHKGVLSGEPDESGNANSFYYWNYSKCIEACLPSQAHGACKNVQISLKNWR